jgi:hypothetical protein
VVARNMLTQNLFEGPKDGPDTTSQYSRDPIPKSKGYLMHRSEMLRGETT